ncbi:MAG: ZIP family metal transporter [Gammaproteobacteria bacterium]|nr:ZIP family metal transporter [Gammaproteobacteria bacterium]
MIAISLKIIVSAVIFFIAVLGALFPVLVKTTPRAKRYLLYGESFSAGVFLGAGFIHLLPDADQFLTHIAHYHYPFMFVICAFTILLLRIIEESAERIFEQSSYLRQTWLAYLLMILLSIHALLAGAALGVETTWATFLVIFLAIIAHKFSESFALGVNMRRSNMRRMSMIKLLSIFSLMTPVGILGGTLLIGLLQAKIGQYTTSTFNAIAAGTFIYIAAFHTRHCHCDEEDEHCDHALPSTFMRLFYFAIGLILTAVVAIWI